MVLSSYPDRRRKVRKWPATQGSGAKPGWLVHCCVVTQTGPPPILRRVAFEKEDPAKLPLPLLLLLLLLQLLWSTGQPFPKPLQQVSNMSKGPSSSAPFQEKVSKMSETNGNKLFFQGFRGSVWQRKCDQGRLVFGHQRGKSCGGARYSELGWAQERKENGLFK